MGLFVRLRCLSRCAPRKWRGRYEPSPDPCTARPDPCTARSDRTACSDPCTDACPAPAAGSAVLVGAGDIASCGSSGDEATAALLDGIAGTVFTTGDNVYESGTASEFANCYGPSWGRHRARTRPVPGNHDWNTANAQGYRDYFGFGPGPLWYSYNLGNWHVVVLDSNCGNVGGCGAGSAQHTWLVNDLAADTRACTVALWHHPRFSSGGEHGSSNATAAFWTALYADGAEVILNGHDHDYERFAPQNPSAVADPNGIREFVVGTGGKSFYAFGIPRREQRGSEQRHQRRSQVDARCRQLQLAVRARSGPHLHGLRQWDLPRAGPNARSPSRSQRASRTVRGRAEAGDERWSGRGRLGGHNPCPLPNGRAPRASAAISRPAPTSPSPTSGDDSDSSPMR